MKATTCSAASRNRPGPGRLGYVEPRYNVTKDLQLYAGVSGGSTDFPNDADRRVRLLWRRAADRRACSSSTSAACTTGIRTRRSSSSPIRPSTHASARRISVSARSRSRDTDFWEVYGKLTWTPIDWLAIGPYVYYSPNWLQTGAKATYAGSTVKVTMPSKWFPADWGAYVSGEAAHYWIGTFTAFGAPLRSARLHHLEHRRRRYLQGLHLRPALPRHRPEPEPVLPADRRSERRRNRHSKWCGASVIGKFSFDLTAMTNLK